MATAQTIINAALRKISAIGAGESPSAAESADCLIDLNQMLDSWRNERLLAYAEVLNERAVSASVSSITIGTAGAWTIERPVEVVGLNWVDGGVADPITLVQDRPEFERLSALTSTGDPSIAHYEQAYPTATLHLYPTTASAGTLQLVSRVVLASFAALSTTVALPPGYELALSSNLAVTLAPGYEHTVSDAVIREAQQSKAAIKRSNGQTPLLCIPAGIPRGRRASGHRSILEG